MWGEPQEEQRTRRDWCFNGHQTLRRLLCLVISVWTGTCSPHSSLVCYVLDVTPPGNNLLSCLWHTDAGLQQDSRPIVFQMRSTLASLLGSVSDEWLSSDVCLRPFSPTAEEVSAVWPFCLPVLEFSRMSVEHNGVMNAEGSIRHEWASIYLRVQITVLHRKGSYVPFFFMEFGRLTVSSQ